MVSTFVYLANVFKLPSVNSSRDSATSRASGSGCSRSAAWKSCNVGTTPRYFTDSRTFEVIGHSVCIDDETLAEAISALPVDRRDIILLSYFLDMSDAEIANVLNMVRRSVA